MMRGIVRIIRRSGNIAAVIVGTTIVLSCTTGSIDVEKATEPPVREIDSERDTAVLLPDSLNRAETPLREVDAEDEFSIVLLPDTQYYSYGAPEVYLDQAIRIVEIDPEYVIHLGDIIDSESYNRKESQKTKEWERADRAHRILDAAKVPYTVIPGNHDMPKKGSIYLRETDNYNKYFGVSRFREGDNTARVGFEHYQGGFPLGKNDSNYSFFDISGDRIGLNEDLNFMVIGLEHAPRKDAMCWAGNRIEQNPDRRTIIATHCYLTLGGERSTCDQDEIIGATGQVLWDELISRYPQIFLAVSGHVGGSEHNTQNRGDWGKVHEILTDYQFDEAQDTQRSYEFSGNRFDRFGNGWLRTLTFRPNDDRIDVGVESVLGKTAFYPRCGNKAYQECGSDREYRYSTEPRHDDHTFGLEYVMSKPIAGKNDPIPPLKKFSDRLVNTNSDQNQTVPDIARSSDGSFVVVWQDDSSGFNQIYARGFDVNGCETLGAMPVSWGLPGEEKNPAIAMDANGNFVVVWEDDFNDNGIYEIKARGFNADGTQRFKQYIVNDGSAGQQENPAVAMDANGNFVVVWEDDLNKNKVYEIKARGFNADGTQRFKQYIVNDGSAGQQKNPAIAMAANGNFVVVWEDDFNDNGIYEIKARGFNADGTQRFKQYIVNDGSAGQQENPAVAMDANGNFVVVWEDDLNKNKVYEIKARGFNADGTQRFKQYTVNDGSAGQQKNPAIAMAANGNFVVVWEDDLNKNKVYEIKARGFNADGTQRFEQEIINSREAGQQLAPAVALDGSMRFVVAWQDDFDKNDYWEILARGCSLEDGCQPQSEATETETLSLLGRQKGSTQTAYLTFLTGRSATTEVSLAMLSRMAATGRSKT